MAKLDTSPLKAGDVVRVTAEETTRPAVVRLAAANGRSIVLQFEGRIGGWLGQLPAFQEMNGSWKTIDGLALVVERV